MVLGMVFCIGFTTSTKKPDDSGDSFGPMNLGIPTAQKPPTKMVSIQINIVPHRKIEIVLEVAVICKNSILPQLIIIVFEYSTPTTLW